MGMTTSASNAPAVESKADFNIISRFTKPLDDFFNKHLAPRSVTYQNIQKINRDRIMFRIAVSIITTAYLAFAIAIIKGAIYA